MSAGKGKRGAEAPLATTSDEDSDDQGGATPQSSPRGPPPSLRLSLDFSPLESSPPQLPQTPKVEVEHDYAQSMPDDYDNVSSPGGSSTASGPTYVRQPGFNHHAHNVQAVSRPKIKKKKTSAMILVLSKDGSKQNQPSPPKTKPKRDPLPMRYRALPQSFWQQPNIPHNISPGAAFPILPPLTARETEGDNAGEERPVTPPADEREKKERLRPERKITVANTDLLFKLFEGVEKDFKAKSTCINGIKRGRPRKVVPCSNKSFMSGEDPYLVECVTEKLFPQLTLEQSKAHASIGGNSSLQLVTLREGDKSITLPSLSVEQNYSQMLSELVAHI